MSPPFYATKPLSPLWSSNRKQLLRLIVSTLATAAWSVWPTSEGVPNPTVKTLPNSTLLHLFYIRNLSHKWPRTAWDHVPTRAGTSGPPMMLISTFLVPSVCWISNIFTLVPERNGSSPAMFLEIVRNAFLCVWLRSALPHLPLLCLMVADIHKVNTRPYLLECPRPHLLQDCLDMCEKGARLPVWMMNIMRRELCEKVDVIVLSVGKLTLLQLTENSAYILMH